jgi:D-inositol-3-phosphate glycosyltransferase
VTTRTEAPCSESRPAASYMPPAATRSDSGSVTSLDRMAKPSSGRLAEIALMTGCDDKTYAIGLTLALIAQGIRVDYIGSDFVDGPELHNTPLVNFLNLRGDQRENASLSKKVLRIVIYYGRLLKYAATARPPIFHILWNNKFELFDRTLLMLYYKLLGKKVVFTAHNVNAGKRNGNDTWLNRLTLKIQYWLSDHIFVHTAKMKEELASAFRVPGAKVSVIPFGINNIFPSTRLTTSEARQRLGLRPGEKAMLFFGRIAPYKGLNYLVSALARLAGNNGGFRLIIAGKIERGCDDYWKEIERQITRSEIRELVIARIELIPDNEVELYFKAADVLVIPYKDIFQSGVPFLAYSFGLPVIATDVGSLREDIIPGKTGFICKPQDPLDLAKTIEHYFCSSLYQQLGIRRKEIRGLATERHSWTKVGEIASRVYGILEQKQIANCPEI